MLKFLRSHWYDLGLISAAAIGVLIWKSTFSAVQIILWLNLIALMLHQFEEYRMPGYFPWVVNTVVFRSELPDRYPLNANTSLVVDALLGWGVYLAAALLHENAVWLGIAVMVISVRNILVHAILLNMLGRTVYNPGMLTSIFLFTPLAAAFYQQITVYEPADALDWAVGLGLGLLLNFVGINKMLDWLKDEETEYVFPERNMKKK